MHNFCVRTIFTDREVLDVCSCLAELFVYLRENNSLREFPAQLTKKIFTQFSTAIFSEMSFCNADDVEDLAIEMFYICKNNIVPLPLLDKTYSSAKILLSGARCMFNLCELEV